MIRGVALTALLLAVVCGQNMTNTTMTPMNTTMPPPMNTTMPPPPPSTTMAPPMNTTMPPPPPASPFWYATYNIAFFPLPPALSAGYCQPLPDTPFIGTPKHVKQACMNGVAVWSFYNDAACSAATLDPQTNMPMMMNSTELQSGMIAQMGLPANDPRLKVFPNLPGNFKFWSCDAGGSNPAIALHTAPAGTPNCVLSTSTANSQIYYGSPACLNNGTFAYKADFNCQQNRAFVWVVNPQDCMTPLNPTMPALMVTPQCMDGPANTSFALLAMKFDATCADFPNCGTVGTHTCSGGNASSTNPPASTTAAPSSGNMVQVVVSAFIALAVAAIFAF